MGLSHSRLWHPNLVSKASGIKKLSISMFFQKKSKEMKTKRSMSVMQNLPATCWFYIIIMCGTGIKTLFILSIICYIIFFFFYIFLHWKVDTDIETKWLGDLLHQCICKLFSIWVFLEFSWEVDVNWLFEL